MFDRIARVYDLMNSVMTAGLHHHWRARAADLAAVGPGDRGARRGDRHRRPRDRARRPRRPGGRGRRLGLLRGDARRAPASKAPGVRFEWGNALELPYPDDDLRRRDGRLRRAQLLRPRPRACAEMARVVRPGGRVVVLEITTPQQPPLSTFFSALVRPRRPAARASSPATPRPTRTCPTRSSASPARRRSPARMAARRPRRRPLGPHRRRDHRAALGARCRADGQRRVRRRRRRGRRARTCPGCWRGSRRAWPSSPRSHGAVARPSTPARRSPPAASGCGRCSCSCAAGPRPRDGDGGAARRRSPSSSSTPRRSSTTTCSTPRRCAAAGRPSSPPAGRAMATATGDLLFARAFAELAAQRAAPRRSACSRTRRSALARGRAAAARRRLGRRRSRSSATCGAASSRPPGCSRPRAGSARSAAAGAADAAGRASGAASGSPSSCSTTCSTSSGPAERTGKHRGTDLLDGTVTLPFILARERDAELARARPARDRDAASRPRRSATRSRRPARSRRRARRRWTMVDGGQGGAAGAARAPQQAALELVADGVVDRYA